MNNPNDLFKHLQLSEMSDFENIELIKKTITDLNTLYIISDDTFSSLAIKK